MQNKLAVFPLHVKTFGPLACKGRCTWPPAFRSCVAVRTPSAEPRPWHSCLCVDFSSNGCEEEKKSLGYLLVMSVFLIEQFPQNPTLRFAWSHFLNSYAEAYFGICSNMFHNSSQLIFFFFFSLWFLNVRFAVTCCACTRT